jgi:5'-nucleotidase
MWFPPIRRTSAPAAVGTDKVFAPGFDVDALVAYLGAGPVAPGTADRITRVA